MSDLNVRTHIFLHFEERFGKFRLGYLDCVIIRSGIYSFAICLLFIFFCVNFVFICLFV
jgi:hypothetical protein